jgi:hypothetical protein
VCCLTGECSRVIEPIWQTEHLPSIDYAQPLNQTRIVDLRGLASKEHACQVTARLLEGKRPSGAKPPTALHSFDPNVLELVRQACDGNPRKFLEMLDTRRSERGGDGLVPEAVIAPCTKISKAAPNITSPPSRRTSHFSRLARPRR